MKTIVFLRILTILFDCFVWYLSQGVVFPLDGRDFGFVRLARPDVADQCGRHGIPRAVGVDMLDAYEWVDHVIFHKMFYSCPES